MLGFTRADVSEAFLLELAVQVVPALFLGALFGYGLAALAVGRFGPGDMSIPLIIGPRTWAIAFATVLASAVASALARSGSLAPRHLEPAELDASSARRERRARRWSRSVTPPRRRSWSTS